MASINPFVLISIFGLVILLVYAFISSASVSNAFKKRKKTYELERVDLIESVEDLEGLIGENLTQTKASNILSLGGKAEKQKIRRRPINSNELNVYGNNPFIKILFLFNNHLAKSHNVVTPQVYMLSALMGAIVGGGAGFWAFPHPWFITALAIVGGVVAAQGYMKSLAKEYRSTVNKQAIAFIQLVIQGLRAGLTTHQAIERAADDLGYPISQELDELLGAIRSRAPMVVACKKAIPETSSAFLKTIYKTIIMCEKRGLESNQTADRLAVIRKSLLVEYGFKKSMMAAAAGAAMAKNVLIILVPGLFLYILNQSPFLMAPLVESVQGVVAIIIGVALYAGGVILSGRILAKLET